MNPLPAPTSATVIQGFAPDALEALVSAPWPGNVRQLRNAMDWLMIMAPGGSAEPPEDDLTQALQLF